MRRALAVAVCTLFLGGTAWASEPTDPNLRESVVDILPEVLDIQLDESIIPLEAEQTKGGRTTIAINSDVLFDFGKATLTMPAKSTLERLAQRMKGKAVQVVGFTDAIGSPTFNLKLSRQRALAVRTELQRLGVTGVRARGFGEAHPVAPNQLNGKDNPDGRAKNRRVELSF
jgi:outer membrane protein OmpA-like peptidoglycan-associated protein